MCLQPTSTICRPRGRYELWSDIHRSAWKGNSATFVDDSAMENLGSGTGAFYELLQIPHNPLRTLKGHRVASIGVDLQPRIGNRPRAPHLLLAPKDGVSLSPQDQGRRVDLTQPGRVIDRKQHPLHVVAPDAGRDFEGLGESH